MERPTLAIMLPVLLPTFGFLAPGAAARPIGADALDLVLQSREPGDETSTPVAPEEGEETPGGAFLEFDIAANRVSDVRFDNVFDGTASITGLRMTLDTGVAFDAGVGWTLVEGLTFKVSAGYVHNEVDLVTAVFRDPVRLPGQSIPFEIAGGGRLIQLPVMGTLHHDFELNDTLSIGLGGGAGVQYSWLTWSYPYGGSKTEGATSFRYEIGADATWRIGDSIRLGAWFGYAGTTRADFGNGASADAIDNLSVGLRIGIRF